MSDTADALRASPACADLVNQPSRGVYMTFLHDASTPFDLSVARQNGTATVAVVGEVDIATAPRLAATLGDHRDAEVLVADLTATTFIDSTGVRVLIEVDRRCTASGRRFVVLVDNGPVLRVLELCELDRWMSVVSGSPARRA
jgi:anti-anti-sigma factor